MAFSGPQVPNPVGTVLSITNAKNGSGQGLNWSFEMQNGWYQGARKYINTLRVITSSPFVGPIQVLRAINGIGGFQGNTYQFPLAEYNGGPGGPSVPTEIDPLSFCQSVDCKQDAEDAKQWLVTLEYGPFNINHELGSSEASNGAVNPLESAPQVNWTGAIYDVSYPQDANGKWFRNTVGDPFENPPKVEEARQTLNFVRNELTYNDNYAQQYRCSLNSDQFLGFAPLQAKCKNIGGERIYSSDFGYYWRVTYEFEFRVVKFTTAGQTRIFGFQEIILNAGFRQLVGNGQLQQILLNGTPITNPQALSLDGVPINKTWVADDSANPDFYYLVYQLYPSVAFAGLNIPQDVLTQSQ